MSKVGVPVLMVEGENLPEAWEKSVIELWKHGIEVPTEYDQPGAPPSRDCVMVMMVKHPFAEPRIHRALPGGLVDLEVYRQEVVNGVHDHWIAPEEGKWSYTYHQRLFGFEIDGERINQIDLIASKLSRTGYSRRAQAITWNPKTDPLSDDPPCLQRLWFRLIEGEGEIQVLQLHSHWRSRDAFKAAFMNIFALTDLQRMVAERIAQATGREVAVGPYLDVSDSYHLYGAYFQDFRKFLETVERRSWEERTWTSEFAESMFQEAREKLAAEAGNPVDQTPAKKS